MLYLMRQWEGEFEDSQLTPKCLLRGKEHPDKHMKEYLLILKKRKDRQEAYRQKHKRKQRNALPTDLHIDLYCRWLVENKGYSYVKFEIVD